MSAKPTRMDEGRGSGGSPAARLGHGRWGGSVVEDDGSFALFGALHAAVGRRNARARLDPLLAVLGLSGCASFGPTSVDRDRFDYIQAIASSWKQQTLLNIVKLRYADTPVFLDVAQVIGSYQLQAGVSVGGGVNFGGPPVPNSLSLGAAGTYTDRPTVVYTPLTGSHFIKVLMTPIPPPALFLLIESGWPADLLLQIGAQTINGISNKRGGARGRTADPEFGQLLAAIQRIQASGAVGLRTEVSKETKQEATVLSLGRKDIPPRRWPTRRWSGSCSACGPVCVSSRSSTARWLRAMT